MFARASIASFLLLIVACDDGTVDTDADASTCDCDDGVFCNGVESCVAGVCQAGTPPCAGTCIEDTNECVERCTDADRDGDCAIDEGGTDCDDDDPNRYGSGVEICDAEGVDEDCDPTTFGTDRDGDGYAPSECCNMTEAGLACGSDCNDASMAVSPEAEEICDGNDNDCDGTTDEGVQMTYYRDADNDNYGLDTDTLLGCSLPSGYTVRGGDCDDDPFDDDPSDPPANERNPGEAETCNEVDDDCDGVPDPLDCECTVPDTRSCVDAGFIGACAVGAQTCIGGVWLGCPAPAANESCGGGDEDCDGMFDEPGAIGSITCWADADDDGFASMGALTSERCTCDGNWTARNPATAADCDDGDPTTYPGADEICDGRLNNCNDTTHDPRSEDADGDGYAAPTAACIGGFPSGDCDDDKEERNPGAGFQSTPVCEPGQSPTPCGLQESPVQRCLLAGGRCPVSCSVTDGVAPDSGLCPDGATRCGCDQPARRCIEATECANCSPTDGTPTETDGTCATGRACECYSVYVTSCETSSSCVLADPGDATEPSVWDFDCNGTDELAPADAGFSCSTISGGDEYQCSKPCTGSCVCPPEIYPGGTRECGAGAQTTAPCVHDTTAGTCVCTADLTAPDSTLPCR